MTIIGGLLTLVAGIVDILTRKPLAHYIYGLNIGNETLMIYLGIIGIVAGLMTLYGGFRNNRDFVITGGALGLVTPSEFSLLSLIGGLLMQKEKVKA